MSEKFPIYFIELTIITISLEIGTLGYNHFENMNWVDAYQNACMILSRMEPVNTLTIEGGKIFAGTYALFSEIMFISKLSHLLPRNFIVIQNEIKLEKSSLLFSLIINRTLPKIIFKKK